MVRAPLVRLMAAIATIGLLAASPLGAQARGHTTWIVRDGFYAGLDAGSGALAFFHVKNRRVYHLRFSLNLTCHDSSTGQDFNVNYSAGSWMPQGLLIPANGTLTIDWNQEDSARLGHIDAELRFHRHPIASFSVQSAGGSETCDGLSAVLLHRARHTPPVPVKP